MLSFVGMYFTFTTATAVVSEKTEVPEDTKVPEAAAVLPEETNVSEATVRHYSSYPFIRIIAKDSKIVSPTDEAFADSAAKIIFPVNRYDLPANSPLLSELADVLIPLLNSDSLQLRKIFIRGAASPEGSTQRNKMLGERRAQSLLAFLTERLKFPVVTDVLETGLTIEDYATLCLLMQRNDDPDYPLVQSLCQKYADNAQLKQQLRRAREGKLWPRLLATYFPELRAARFMLVFSKPVYLPPPPPGTCVLSLTDIQPADITIPTPALQTKEPVAVVIARDTIPATPCALAPRRELLAVKTNLLYDLAYMPGYDRWCPIPNIAVEYYPKGGHFTFGASIDFPWWQHYSKQKYFQVRNYQIEARYYLRAHGAHGAHGTNETDGAYERAGGAFRGLYFQGYVHGGVFGLCFDANRGWVGEGAGAGVGAGYVLPISRNGHWRLEFALQAGFFRCKYDPYQYENPVNPAYRDHLYYYKWTQKPALFHKRQYRWTWMGPTRVGITLTYDLLYRRTKKETKTHPHPLPVREGSIYQNSQNQ